MKFLPLALLFTTLATGCASYRQQVRNTQRQQVSKEDKLSVPPPNNPYTTGRDTVEWLRQEGYIVPGGSCVTLARFPEDKKNRLRACISWSREKKSVQGKIVIDFP